MCIAFSYIETVVVDDRRSASFHEQLRRKENKKKKKIRKIIKKRNTTWRGTFLLFSTFNVAQHPRSMRRLLRHGYDLRRVTEEVVSQIVSH